LFCLALVMSSWIFWSRSLRALRSASFSLRASCRLFWGLEKSWVRKYGKKFLQNEPHDRQQHQ
jgi:hypothetical protein